MRPTGSPELERRRSWRSDCLARDCCPPKWPKRVGVDRRSVRRWKAAARVGRRAGREGAASAGAHRRSSAPRSGAGWKLVAEGICWRRASARTCGPVGGSPSSSSSASVCGITSTTLTAAARSGLEPTRAGATGRRTRRGANPPLDPRGLGPASRTPGAACGDRLHRRKRLSDGPGRAFGAARRRRGHTPMLRPRGRLPYQRLRDRGTRRDAASGRCALLQPVAGPASTANISWRFLERLLPRLRAPIELGVGPAQCSIAANPSEGWLERNARSPPRHPAAALRRS